MSIIPKQWHSSWNNFLTKDRINELKEIEAQIGQEVVDYFPNERKVLRFLQQDANQIKCIIVGMEPYPSYKKINGVIIPEATGRSFEISSVTNWNQKFKQSSLRNILKSIYLNDKKKKISLEEVRKEIKNNTFTIKQPKSWFDSLEQQGVLFLNATLTVKPKEVNTHTKIWETFMKHLISYLDREDIVWFLWGEKSQSRVEPNIKYSKIIKCCHPRLSQFVDRNCFQEESRINWLG